MLNLDDKIHIPNLSSGGGPGESSGGHFPGRLQQHVSKPSPPGNNRIHSLPGRIMGRNINLSSITLSMAKKGTIKEDVSAKHDSDEVSPIPLKPTDHSTSPRRTTIDTAPSTLDTMLPPVHNITASIPAIPTSTSQQLQDIVDQQRLQTFITLLSSPTVDLGIIIHASCIYIYVLYSHICLLIKWNNLYFV